MSGRALGAGGGPAPASCPCRSATTSHPLAYAVCCGPLHAHDRAAATAEQLMRSRYSAFAAGDAAYLVRTWHPRTRPDDLTLDPTVRWTGLTVVRTERGDVGDRDGVVEFVASWEQPSAAGVQRGRLHEVSRFERRAGRWLYLDGDGS